MLNETIEKLLVYANAHLGLDEEDNTYTRNILMDLCNVSEPFFDEMNISAIRGLKVPDILIQELRSNLLLENVCDPSNVDRFIVKIMGTLTPRPSEVTAKFKVLQREKRAKATDYLYDLQIKNNYIQKSAVDRNLHWVTDFDKNNLEITINLSKPEKDNKDIARAKHEDLKDSKYPACVLCKENVGYAGRSDHPARGNLRTIPLKLDTEAWHLQYSPYVYYNKHCIVFEDVHEPMIISKRTMARLFNFVDIFPHFFIGSNADLPIVGGSILNHEHFQGGEYEFPMMKAENLVEIPVDDEELEVHILDWYNSTIHLSGTNKERIIDAMAKILNAWKVYENKQLNIIPATADIPHSTITPIVKRDGRVYHAYMILRNNRTDENYPDGIFHAHPEYHPIKKEGIGLIEAMGMFILPARLKRQLGEIANIYKEELVLGEVLQDHPDLEIFGELFTFLEEENANEETVEELITTYVNNVCREILKNTAVFKDDEEGSAAFLQFINEVKI